MIFSIKVDDMGVVKASKRVRGTLSVLGSVCRRLENEPEWRPVIGGER